MSKRESKSRTARRRQQGDEAQKRPVRGPEDGHRAVSSPASAGPLLDYASEHPEAPGLRPLVADRLRALQATHGNRYVQRMVKSTLKPSHRTHLSRWSGEKNSASGVTHFAQQSAVRRDAPRRARVGPKVSESQVETARPVPFPRRIAGDIASANKPAVQRAPAEGGKGTKPARPKSKETGKLYYLMILKPLMAGLWDQLHQTVEEHRHHLLALACLRAAAGPGADPLKVVAFCKRYKLPLTLPVVGLIARTVGKLDVTRAVSTGIKIIAALGPLLGKIRVRNATLIALDTSIVPTGDTTQVGSILEGASSPKEVIAATKRKAAEVRKKTAEVERYAAKMKAVEKRLGI